MSAREKRRWSQDHRDPSRRRKPQRCAIRPATCGSAILGFTGGEAANVGPNRIDKTDFAQLYYGEHHGMSARQTEGLLDGRYTVKPYFAETSRGG